MALALPALLCVASGFALVSMWWSRRGEIVSDLILRASLAIGYGLGVFSVVFVLARALGVSNIVIPDLVVVAASILAFLVLRNRGRASTVAAPRAEVLELPKWLDRIIVAAFGVSLCAAIYSAFMRTLAHPHGEGWDAFSIWNLHARFLFLSGTRWRDGFSTIIPWSHPDYPLLLPAAIAHFWSYLGHDDASIPDAIGFLFTFSTVGLLFSALWTLRGRTTAMLGGLALLTTPFFIELGTSQYADVPLAFFILATITLLCLHDDPTGRGDDSRSRGLIVLAGLGAGFAAWTKNEGLLFLCAILVARFVMLVRPQSRGDRAVAFAILLAAIAPMFFLIAWFKHSIAPPGDLFSDISTAMRKALDPTRYGAILKWYGKEFLRFGHWLLIPGTILLAGLSAAPGFRRSQVSQSCVRSSAFALVLTLAGYFAVYLITPYDLYWHLRFSLGRLFMQLWPSTVFLFFLAFRKAEDNAARDRQHREIGSLTPESVSK
jgi:hypothetical protein